MTSPETLELEAVDAALTGRSVAPERRLGPLVAQQQRQLGQLGVRW